MKELNGYKLMADSYRQLLEKDPTADKEDAQRKIKVNDFLSTCNEQEIHEIFNSTAFNTIVKGYILKTCDQLKISTKTKQNIMNEFRYQLDTTRANEAADYYYNH